MTPLSGFLCFGAVLLILAGGPIYAGWALFGVAVLAQAAPVLYANFVLSIIKRYGGVTVEPSEADAPAADYDQAVAELSDVPAPDHRPLTDEKDTAPLRLQTDPEGPTGDTLPEDTRVAAL